MYLNGGKGQRLCNALLLEQTDTVLCITTCYLLCKGVIQGSSRLGDCEAVRKQVCGLVHSLHWLASALASFCTRKQTLQ